MAIPDRLRWGHVPDEEQRTDIRRKIRRIIHAKRPPLPSRYADELTDEIMAEIEQWDWWRTRWYPEYDE